MQEEPDEAFDSDAWDQSADEPQIDEVLGEQSEKIAQTDSTAVAQRISADIAGRVPTWSGVRGCSDERSAIAAMTPHYDKWVGDTIAAHPDLTPLAKGYLGHRWYKNRTSNTGRRTCKGGFTTLTVYVDFA